MFNWKWWYCIGVVVITVVGAVVVVTIDVVTNYGWPGGLIIAGWVIIMCSFAYCLITSDW